MSRSGSWPRPARSTSAATSARDSGPSWNHTATSRSAPVTAGSSVVRSVTTTMVRLPCQCAGQRRAAPRWSTARRAACPRRPAARAGARPRRATNPATASRLRRCSSSGPAPLVGDRADEVGELRHELGEGAEPAAGELADLGGGDPVDHRAHGGRPAAAGTATVPPRSSAARRTSAPVRAMLGGERRRPARSCRCPPRPSTTASAGMPAAAADHSSRRAAELGVAADDGGGRDFRPAGGVSGRCSSARSTARCSAWVAGEGSMPRCSARDSRRDRYAMQRAARPAGPLVGQHDRAAGVLVERVVAVVPHRRPEPRCRRPPAPAPPQLHTVRARRKQRAGGHPQLPHPRGPRAPRPSPCRRRGAWRPARRWSSSSAKRPWPSSNSAVATRSAASCRSTAAASGASGSRRPSPRSARVPALHGGG